MIPMKAAILVSRSLAGISFQLARPRQGCIIFDLHQDLINRGSQQGEACEPSSGGFGVPIFPSVSSSSHLLSPILPGIFLPFPLLRFFLLGQ